MVYRMLSTIPESLDVKFSVKQKAPSVFKSFAVLASGTYEALEIVASMIEQGAIEVEVIDENGRHYDLIDLETTFDEENAIL
jgi:hypothetical protein